MAKQILNHPNVTGDRVGVGDDGRPSCSGGRRDVGGLSEGDRDELRCGPDEVPDSRLAELRQECFDALNPPAASDLLRELMFDQS